MWKNGDRVLARRRPGVFSYPGTIRHIDGERLYVIFDDGEDAFVSRQHLTPCQFESGDQINVLNPSVDDFLPGQVSDVKDKQLLVTYTNGNEEWVDIEKVRVNPQTWKQTPPAEEEEPAPAWSVCDRVLACGYDLDWYPGIVLEIEPDRIHVLFDFGQQAAVPLNKIRPLRINIGDKVQCRCKSGPDYFAAQITEVDGEKIQIHYEEGGDTEATSVRLVRINRDEWFAKNAEMNVERGQRVLAQWYDMFWYPGLVVNVDGKRVRIAYDDADQALVTPDQIKPLALNVGSHVHCRFQDGPEYLPGEITKKRGDNIHVQYEDGRSEWTSIKMIRMER